uniref:Uncharacterized protein n=1 Tax=Arundo donax TaxID=35708 RepID=A0A0A9EYS1_ARUDO
MPGSIFVLVLVDWYFVVLDRKVRGGNWICGAATRCL